MLSLLTSQAISGGDYLHLKNLFNNFNLGFFVAICATQVAALKGLVLYFVAMPEILEAKIGGTMLCSLWRHLTVS